MVIKVKVPLTNLTFDTRRKSFVVITVLFFVVLQVYSSISEDILKVRCHFWLLLCNNDLRLIEKLSFKTNIGMCVNHDDLCDSFMTFYRSFSLSFFQKKTVETLQYLNFIVN